MTPTRTFANVATGELMAQRKRTVTMLAKAAYVQQEDGRLSGEATIELNFLSKMLREDLRAFDAELAVRARMVPSLVAGAVGA